MRKIRRERIIEVALLALAIFVFAWVLVPTGARAGQLKHFSLPSPLIDTSTPGGRLADGYDRK